MLVSDHEGCEIYNMCVCFFFTYNVHFIYLCLSPHSLECGFRMAATVCGSWIFLVQFNQQHQSCPNEAGSHLLKGKVAYRLWISARSLRRLNHVIQTEEETKMDVLPLSNGLFFPFHFFLQHISLFPPRILFLLD